MRTFSVICILVFSISIMSCGGGDYGSPTSTFKTMVAAAKAENKDAAMECYSKDTCMYMKELEDFAKKAGGEQKDNEMLDQFQKIEPVYGEEKIDGDTATLAVTVDGKTESIKFVKEGGDWKVNIPELKSAVDMMKNAGDMMKGMMEGAKKSLPGDDKK